MLLPHAKITARYNKRSSCFSLTVCVILLGTVLWLFSSGIVKKTIKIENNTRIISTLQLAVETVEVVSEVSPEVPSPPPPKSEPKPESVLEKKESPVKKQVTPEYVKKNRSKPRKKVTEPVIEQSEKTLPPAEKAMSEKSGPPVVAGKEKDEVLARIMAAINKHKVYPRNARRAGITGTVRVKIFITAQGTIKEYKVQGKSHRLLQKAVKQTMGKVMRMKFGKKDLSQGISVVVPIEFILT